MSSSPMDATGECMLCRPEVADALFTRARLWEDEHWRLSAVLQGPIAGFAHLETRRRDRIPHLHFNLAPHRTGNGRRGGPGLLDPDVQDVDSAVHQAVAAAAAHALADNSATGDGMTPTGRPH